MRRIGFKAIAGVAMVGALGSAAASPAWAAAATPSVEATVGAFGEASASQGSGITVGTALNQATGDVLGLGYEQVVRIDGSAVVISEPQTRGGAELRRFEAGLDLAWPTESTVLPRALFYGGTNLASTVKHEASRIAVLGDRIFVSRLLTQGSPWRTSAGSEVSIYTADGVQTGVTNLDGDKALAVTGLDAYEHDGRQYLAVGLNTQGVRVLRVDHDETTGTDELREFRRVGAQFDGRNALLIQRDQSTVVKLGTDATGRLTLVAGQLTYDAPAVIASDLHVEAGDDAPYAATTIWQNNYRPQPNPSKDFWQYPDVVDFGRLGGADAQGPQLVAIAWPTLGRVSFVDAETGHDFTWLDGAAAHTVRFFTGSDDTGYVAIARDAAEGVGSYTIATINALGELIPVREGSNDELPSVIAELGGA